MNWISVKDELPEMGVEVISPAVKSLFVPDEAKLNECVALGKLVSQKLAERVKLWTRACVRV